MKNSKMKKTGDLPRAGDVYVNDSGGSCKIISVDEPSLSDEHESDNFQVAYQMGDSYPVCHRWKDVKVMLDYNGYKYQASTKKSKVAKSDVTIDANTYLMCYGADGYKHTKVKIPKNIRLRAGGELYFLDSTPSKDYGHKYPWAVEYHSGPKSNKFALYVYLDAEDGKILARVNRSDGTYVADTYDYLQRDCSDMEQKLSQIYDWFDEVLSNQKAQELDSEAEDRLYYASAKKSYTPDYKDFRSMVGSIRNTRDHNKVFKE